MHSPIAYFISPQIRETIDFLGAKKNKIVFFFSLVLTNLKSLRKRKQ